MDVKNNIKKRKSIDKPLCKYGLSCYRKNPEHLKKFRHPDPEENELKIDVSKPNVSSKGTPKKDTEQSTSFNKEINTLQSPDTGDTNFDESNELDIIEDGNDSVEETVQEILKSMPKDFFDFWEFCTSVNKSKPQDAFSEYGYHLIGLYDLLAKKLPKDMKVDISCHWRYYFDPPEFQTVIKKDGSDLYHIGYFRDDPSEKPFILASNNAAKDSKLTLVGDNIFCAMNSELNEVIRSLKLTVSKAKVTQLQKDLMQHAKAKNYALKMMTEQTKRRQKKVVAKTFNGLGIVVPVKNDIGYRPLPDSDAVLKNILKKIVSAGNKTKQLKEQEALDEIISNVNFANDECDYGMGLELGIDLFCYGEPYFHDVILRILPLAYDLLNRSKYAAIVRAHLKNRKQGGNLSTLNL